MLDHITMNILFATLHTTFFNMNALLKLNRGEYYREV